MADYDTIVRALRNAHAAGDVNAAQRLAKMATVQAQGSWLITAPDGRQFPVSGADPEAVIAALRQQMTKTPANAGQSDRPWENDPIVEGGAEDRWWEAAPVVEATTSAAPPSTQGQKPWERYARSSAAPIEIEAPDGSIVEFPAGTDDATISRAMREGYDRGVFSGTLPSATAQSGAGPWTKYQPAGTQQKPKWMDAPVVEDASKLSGLTANAGVGTQRAIAEFAGLPVDALTGAINGIGDLTGLWGPIENPVGGAESIFQALSPLHSQVAEPQTMGERLARRVGHDVTAATIPGAGAAIGAGRGLLSALLGDAVSGAGAGLGGGLMQEITDNPMANLAGTLMGSIAAPIAVNGTVRGLGHVVSPNGGADPARLSAARTLDQHGIQTTAGQKVGNDTLRRMEAATGAGRSRLSAQDEQFTQAALRALGTDAKRATPEVLEQTQRRIGQVFDDVLGNVSIRPDPGVSQRATAAMDTYRELAPATEAAPLITNVGQRLIDAASSGQNIAGQTARAWRSQLSRALKSSSEATRSAASELLEVLDDATSQALKAAGRSDDVQRLASARRQYRDFLAVERAVTGAGEDAAKGIITPARLRSAVSGQGARAYTQGRRGDLGELARAGATVLGRPNSSGTAENAGTAIRTGLGILGTAAAHMAGAGPLAAPAFGVASAVAPTAVNRLVMTGPMQRYLANQGVSPVLNALAPNFPGGLSPSALSVLNALTGSNP